MRPPARVWLGLVVTIVGGCGRPSPGDQRTIQRWLLCEECVEGERDAVVALGDAGVNVLREALRGPPSRRVENIRHQAGVVYERLPAQMITRQEYVAHHVSNYVATYQLRSAVALRGINTRRSHAALINALRDGTIYREDVLNLLGDSAGVVDSIRAGDNQHAPVDSFVRLKPTIVVRDSTTGQRLANVRVVFRVDSGGGRVEDSVRLTDLEGQASVRWRLGSSAADSVNVLTAVAAGQTVRFRAQGHPWGNRIVFLVQPGNVTRGQPFTPTVKVAVRNAWNDPIPVSHTTATVIVPTTTIAVRDTFTAGVAAFPGLIVDQIGTGFRLEVRVLGAPPVLSAPFDVTP